MEKHSNLFSISFMMWLPLNPDVWQMFCDEAVAIHRRGFKHYSARTIIQVLRHHSSLRDSNGPWKLNDHHTPYLARLFDLTHPERSGLWEYRETKRVAKDRLFFGEPCEVE
jgi:hypothetical protein